MAAAHTVENVPAWVHGRRRKGVEFRRHDLLDVERFAIARPVPSPLLWSERSGNRCMLVSHRVLDEIRRTELTSRLQYSASDRFKRALVPI